MVTVHERDCAPCDAARAVVDMLADEFDPNDLWLEHHINGVLVHDHLVAKTAAVLHQFPSPGGQS